jgi:putative chitinase
LSLGGSVDEVAAGAVEAARPKSGAREAGRAATKLFDAERVELPAGLGAGAQAGARFLLGQLSGDAGLAAGCGVAGAAYMMATAEHETWRKYQPVEEVGRGAGHGYGVALKVASSGGTTRENVYYGRGYVQLTWQANYLRMGAALGMGRGLMERPELALVPATAYAILSRGMLGGLFTGRRLGTYVNATMTDYVGARRVVNGQDCAEKIAELAKAWEGRMGAASV